MCRGFLESWLGFSRYLPSFFTYYLGVASVHDTRRQSYLLTFIWSVSTLMITSNSNVEGSLSSTSRPVDWWNEIQRVRDCVSSWPGELILCHLSIRLRWSYLGEFHLLSVIRLPLPLEGSANLAHKGSGWNYARLSCFTQQSNKLSLS